MAVNLCICFHQLMDKGSKTTVRVVTNLIIEECHLGTLSTTARSFSWGHQNFSSTNFLPNRTMAPFIKISLSLLPHFLTPQLDHPIPSCSYWPTLSFTTHTCLRPLQVYTGHLNYFTPQGDPCLQLRVLLIT